MIKPAPNITAGLRPGVCHQQKEFPYIIQSMLLAPAVGCFVEIGTKRSRTTECIVRILARHHPKRRTTVYTIDPSDRSRRRFEKRYEHWIEYGLLKLGRGARIEAALITGFSQDVYEQVDQGIAWLFVDGCHCRECAGMDFERYVPKLEIGGILVVYDLGDWSEKDLVCMREDGKKKKFGVAEAFEEFMDQTSIGLEKLHRVPSGPVCGGLGIYKRTS